MPEPVFAINPVLLKWARERAGYSVGDVAKALKKDEGLVKRWEQGTEAPTYAQLERLAYKIYRRPLAMFFFPTPPEERSERRWFRTLPDSEIADLSPDTRYAIREAVARRISLYELFDGRNPSELPLLKNFSANATDSGESLATQVRKLLKEEISDQLKIRRSEDAFEKWRGSLGTVGIFVFKRSFKQRDLSGFGLYDDEFPLIYVNNSNSFTRQSFTLFHELCHLLLHVSGITKVDDSYVQALSGDSKNIEVLCNRFASEFLVPEEGFAETLRGKGFRDQLVSYLAERYKVSREVILRKMLDRGFIGRDVYEAKAAQWKQDFLRRKTKGTKGNYYRTEVAYLGTKYLNVAFHNYYSGRITVDQLADHLGVKVSSIAGLEGEVLRRKSLP
jgi:Zn-dependent peptidase ImmA (M78 family)